MIFILQISLDFAKAATNRLRFAAAYIATNFHAQDI
jgi:hypothetical protein